jgi:hypothetical protein
MALRKALDQTHLRMKIDGGVLGRLIRALAYISVADERAPACERVVGLGQARVEIEAALLDLEARIIAAEREGAHPEPVRLLARGTGEFGDPIVIELVESEED